MAELVLLGHFVVVAALSHYCGGLWNLIRLPHVVALCGKCGGVLRARAGVRTGGFHRFGGRLVDCVDHLRCGGRESRVTSANLAGGRTIRHLQRSLGTAARGVAGTHVGAAPQPGTLFRRFYFAYGIGAVDRAVPESLWGFRRVVASSRSPLFRVFSGVARGQRRRSRIGGTLRVVPARSRGDCVLRGVFVRLAVAASCRPVSRGGAEASARARENPPEKYGA